MASYLYVFNTYSIKTNTIMHVLKLFNQQTKVIWSDTPAVSLDSFAFGTLGLGNKYQLSKEKNKGALGTEGNATAFSMLPAWLSKAFTFTTSRCSSQLTQLVLTFHGKRNLRMTSLVVCDCSFEIAACGPLIYYAFIAGFRQILCIGFHAYLTYFRNSCFHCFEQVNAICEGYQNWKKKKKKIDTLFGGLGSDFFLTFVGEYTSVGRVKIIWGE